MHISNPEEKAWIQQRIEGVDKGIQFTENGKKAILQKLVEAEGFEQFIDVKYKGTKRFGLDGGEALIPALEQILKRGGSLGMKEVVLGMAHRGRLNVLSQVMNKPHRAIFHEFKGGSFKPDDVEGSGDVKYHLGASSGRDLTAIMCIYRTANPSHLKLSTLLCLEKPVKQDLMHDRPLDGGIIPLDKRAEVYRFSSMETQLLRDKALCQNVFAYQHRATALQGSSTLSSTTKLVLLPIRLCSSPYPSDVAKMIEAPIFHVNGDDPEAVVYAAKIATEYRMKFHKPVVVDMFCYRRYGHNEGDEPAFTQPLCIKIKGHALASAIYAKRLESEKVISAGEYDTMKQKWRIIRSRV